jgi:hypothetical protein
MAANISLTLKAAPGTSAVSPSSYPITVTAASVTLADTGGYLTATDVEAAFAELPNKFLGQEAWHNFQNKANGDLNTLDSGQTWLPAWNTTIAANKPTISGGALVVANTTVGQTAAGYAQVLLSSTVKRIGCDVTFSSYSTLNGAVAVVIWKDNPVVQTAGALTIPYSPMHLVITPTTWGVSIWETPTGPVTVGSGTFITPLTADGTTVHRIEAEIIGSTMYLFLPNGQVESFTDARVNTYAGRYANWEPYRLNANTDSQARVLQVWASSVENITDQHAASQAQLVKAIKRLTTYPIAQGAIGTDGTSITLTGTNQAIPGLSISTARVGATSRILVEAELYVTHTSGLLLFDLTINGSAASIAVQSSAFTGRAKCTHISTPGVATDFTVSVGAWTTGAGSVQRAAASGQLGSLKITAI